MYALSLVSQISKLEEIYGLKKYVPQVTYLDLSDNPLCEDKSYRWVSGRFWVWCFGTQG